MKKEKEEIKCLPRRCQCLCRKYPTRRYLCALADRSGGAGDGGVDSHLPMTNGKARAVPVSDHRHSTIRWLRWNSN